MRIGQSPTVAVVDEARRKDPELYRTLSFGQLPSGVDWIWILSLTETELNKVEPGKHSTFFYDLDLLTDLDPLFSEVYVTGANLLAVVQNDGRGAQALLVKAERFRNRDLPAMPDAYREEYWAHPWQVPLLLAYVHLFELNDMPNASIYFKEAANLPGAPVYLPKLAKRLEQPGGEYEVGMKLIDFMISGASDPKVREELEKKRSNLLVAQYLHELNLGFSSFLRSHPHRLEQAWTAFREAGRLSLEDPWGGRLSLDSNGKIVSTTPHDRVFGLD